MPYLESKEKDAARLMPHFAKIPFFYFFQHHGTISGSSLFLFYLLMPLPVATFQEREKVLHGAPTQHHLSEASSILCFIFVIIILMPPTEWNILEVPSSFFCYIFYHTNVTISHLHFLNSPSGSFFFLFFNHANAANFHKFLFTILFLSCQGWCHFLERPLSICSLFCIVSYHTNTMGVGGRMCHNWW